MKKKILGTVMVILLPITLFLVALIGYPIAKIMINSGSISDSSASGTAGILNTIFGLCGILGMIGLFTSLPAGIYFLTKKAEDKKIIHSSLHHQLRQCQVLRILKPPFRRFFKC